MFYVPDFSCFLLEAEVFSPFFSYVFIIIHWMFNSWLLKHAVLDSMDLNFTSFRPIWVGKKSVWAAWNMPDGAVSVQVHKHHQPVTVEQWEPLLWPLQFFLHASHRKTKEEGWYQRSLKTSRRKFMENSEILCLRKIWKNLKVWERLHLHREEVAKVNIGSYYLPWGLAVPRPAFHPSANVERCFALRSFEGAPSRSIHGQAQKRVYQRRWWLPSRASHGIKMNKVLAETHESLRSTSGCIGPPFWTQTSHLLLFLLAPSATAPRGVPAVPWMWRPAVALQFRERGLWRPSVCGKRGRWKQNQVFSRFVIRWAVFIKHLTLSFF